MSERRIQVNDLFFVPYLKVEAIDQAIAQMADEIANKLGDRDPLFVCIMNGAFMFASELFRYLDDDYEVAFARYASYEGTVSTNKLTEIMPLSVPVAGRTVVIVEDLIDTGFTMKCLKEKYLAEGAREVYVATMLLKEEALTNDVATDFVGLRIENKFIVGHGLDYNGRGRLYKDIYILDENAQKEL